jgi:hypothetical protein
MSEFHGLDADREGRRGSTIDSEEGVAISVFPHIPVIDLITRSVTINSVSTKSGAVQSGRDCPRHQLPCRGHVRVMFHDLEQFATAHRPCGGLTSDVGDLTDTGYRMQLVCSCGAAFERWVTPDAADRDLLGSSVLAFPN